MKLQLNQNTFTIEKILNQKIFISFSTLMFQDIHRTSHICPNMVDAVVPEKLNLM